MSFANKFARFMRNSGPARFFVPVGIILIIFGIILLGLNTGSYEKTVGQVTSVAECPRNPDEEQQYDVSFTYTVDGKEYENVFNNITGNFSSGDNIDVFYDPADPQKTANSKMNGFEAPILIALGALALLFGIYKTSKAFQKSKELDNTAAGIVAPRIDFEGFKQKGDVTEYYCRFDGNSLKPGYIIEDAGRNILFEGKMLKNNLVGPRTFEFTDHTTGKVSEHSVGHTATQTYNDEFFSISSWFKFDGRNVWDILHDRGLRMTTDIRSKFPNLTYEVSKDGRAFAIIETTSKYVHEDEEAQHKIAIPVGRYYYRFWTASDDLDTLFLTIFAISETEQTVVE